MNFKQTLLTLFMFILSLISFSQKTNDAPLSKDAPTDKPHSFKSTDQLKEYDEIIKPYVKKAQKTLQKAKKKFKKGLKDGQAFFLTTRIYDTQGNYEQIFVRVQTWNKEYITGTIANDLFAVKGYSFGQQISFPESAVLDWLITNPDGSEEGNFVGKFLDTLR